MRARIIIAACLAAVCGLVLAQSEWDFGIGQKDQVTKGLVSYWSMRNSGTTVYDEWGTNTGTAINGPVIAYTNGVVDRGTYFDGTNDYISTTSLGPSGDISVSMWIKMFAQTSGGSFWRTVWRNGVVDTNGVYIAGSRGDSTGQLNFRVGAGYAAFLAIGTSAWHHVCIAWDDAADIAVTYVDGVGATSNMVGTANNPTVNIEIGGDNSTPTLIRYIKANIDEVRVYNRAITSNEVKQLYRMGATPRGIR
jgi:hypothetical protein